MSRFSFLLTIWLTLIGTFSADLPANERFSQSPFQNPNSQLEHLPIQEEEILFEIDRINQQIEKLEKSGQLNGTTKIVIAGLLGTIAYGVAHANLVWIFNPEFYLVPGIAVVTGPAWINAVLRGILDAAIPGIAIGALLGFANENPDNLPSLNLEIRDLVEIGVISAVSTLAATLLAATTCAALQTHCIYFGSSMLSSASFTLPAITIVLFAKMYEYRVKLKSLKDQLKEAYETLYKKRNANPQTPALPEPV